MRKEMRSGNENVNVNVSSIVNEVIRTIFFFLRENSINIKSTKRHI